MAKLFLTAGDTITINNSLQVFGGTGAETLNLAAAATAVTIDGNVDNIQLAGASSDYKFQVSGTSVLVYSGSTLVATIAPQDDTNGTDVFFSNGSAFLVLTGLSAATLGGAAVSTTAGGTTLTPTLTPPTALYSIAASTSSTTEGNSVTFTVTSLAGAVAANTTLNYEIAGTTVGTAVAAATAADFLSNTGSVTILAGQSTATFTVTPVSDGTAEGFEGFKVNLLDSSYNVAASSGNVVISDPVVSGQTFTLTSATDLFTGGSGNDNFNGVVSTTAGASTLQAGDQLTGGTGTDTVNASVTGTGGVTTNSVTYSGIENVLVSDYSTAGGTVFDMSLADSSLTKVGLTGSASTASVEFTGLANFVNAQMNNGAASLKLTYTKSTSGTTDVQALALGGQTAGTFTANGMETINITSSTAANTIVLADDALKTITATGDQKLTLTESATNTITRVDASGMTAAFKITTNDTTAISVTGGSANDTIVLSADNFTSADSIDGGAGTDTLSIATTIAAATTLANVTNVEVLQITGANNVTLAANVAPTTFDVTPGTDVSTVTFNSGYTNATTVKTDAGDIVSNSGANVALTVEFSSDDAVTVTGGTGTDTLKVTASTSAVTFAGAITAVDTVTIVDYGDDAAGGSKPAGEDVTLTLGAYATALTIDGSALDGGTVDSNGAMNADYENLTVSGASATKVLNITGGAGADNLTGGTANDIINGGAGNDTIDGTAGGNDNFIGGDGDDTFSMGTALTSGDTIDGGAGNDILSVTALDGTGLTNITNIETLSLSGSGSSATLTSNLSFTTIDMATVDNLAQTLTLATGYTNATTVLVDAGDKVVNSANVALTVNGKGADFASTTITGGTGTDTLNITADSTTVTTSGLITLVDTINVLDNGDAASGSKIAGKDLTLDLTSYATATKALTIDATALDAGTVDADNVMQADYENLTITGVSARALIVTGGAGADTIVGSSNGTLGDSLTGGAGNDTFTMGTNLSYLDTIQGGDNTDTITTGAVLDVAFMNVRGVENLTLAGTATLSSYFDATGIATVNLDATGSAVDGSGTAVGVNYVSKGAVNESVAGGLGNDSFKFNDTFTIDTNDSINGGAGTDTVIVNNANTGSSTTAAAIDFNKVTKVENVTLGTAFGKATTTAEIITLNVSTTITSTTAQTISLDGSLITDSKDTINITNGNASTTTKFSVTGGAGADTLAGGAANDTISGGAGNDIITGGLGSDRMTGGDGNDIFKFALGNSINAAAGLVSTNATPDTITDFVSGTDHIQITMATATEAMTFDATDKGDVTTNSDILSLLSGTGAVPAVTNRPGQYAFNTVTQQMVMDSDGSGLIQATDFALTLTGATGLSSADIDFVITTANGANSVTIGNGNNTVVGGTAVDTITTGTGNDNITGGGDADVISTGAGDDIIRTATIAVGMSINAGAGTADTLVLTASGLDANNLIAAYEDIVTGAGIEQLIVTAGGTTTLDGTLLTGDTLAINSIAAGNAVIALGTLTAVTNNFSGLSFSAVTYGTATGVALGNDDNDYITVTLGNGGTFTGTSIKDSITAGTGADSINAGNGNDTIIMGANLTVADTIVGGSGTDTLTITDDTAVTDLDGVSGIEVITVTSSGTANAYTLSGNTLIAAGANLSFTNSAVQALTLNIAANTTTGTLTYVGNTAVDTVTTGSGAATITGGAGADAITLTSTSADTVILAPGTSTTVDTITGFTPASDILSISITAQAGSLVSNGNNGAVTAAATPVVQHALTATATTIAAATNILVLDATYADIAAVTTAIVAGGSTALTETTAFTANSDFLVAWTNGTNSYLYLINDSQAGGVTAALAAGESTATQLVTFSGLTSVAGLVAADFSFIA